MSAVRKRGLFRLVSGGNFPFLRDVPSSFPPPFLEILSIFRSFFVSTYEFKAAFPT